MEKKILTLNVSKQWFDMIVSGEKTEEYRVIKPYWASRLVNQKVGSGEVHFDGFCGYIAIIGKLEYKPYTHVLFINGYRKDSPRIEKEIESITIGKPKRGLCPDRWLGTEFFVIKFKSRMTNKEFFNAHCGEPVLYKGKDIGAYVAGYIEEKYIILGFDDYTGCIQSFTPKVNKTLGGIYNSYRFAKLKYLEVIKHR